MRKFICLLLCLTMVLSACTFAKADLFDDLGGLFSNLGDMAGDLWGDAAEWAENKFGEASEWSEEAFGNVTEWAENAYGDVSEWAENAFGDVKEWSEDAIHATGSFLSTVWGDVSEASGNAWSWVEQAATDVGDTFTKSYEDVSQWVSMTGDNILEFLKKQLYNLFSQMGFDIQQSDDIFRDLTEYAEKNNISTEKMIKLVLPYVLDLAWNFVNMIPVVGNALDLIEPSTVSNMLIFALTDLGIFSEASADQAIEDLQEVLNELPETDAD